MAFPMSDIKLMITLASFLRHLCMLESNYLKERTYLSKKKNYLKERKFYLDRH
jgi:hypothetical protein